MASTVMLPLRALVEAHRDEIKAVIARHKGTRVAIFGSVARGDETPDSDIDLLVDFAPRTSLFDVVRMEMDLAELLGRKVDVMSRAALNDRDDDVRREAQPL
jgi:predicted nucleotidyltransferase